MNIYLVIIMAVLVGSYLLELMSDILNVRHVREALPEEFVGHYDAEKYGTSQKYLRENTRFGIATDTIQLAATLAMILLGGFQLVDGWARAPGWPLIPTGLLFAGMLLLASQILTLPFSLYGTFVIEERYGFNKTTLKTFLMDRIKGWMLAAIIGGGLFSAVIWFFEATGPLAWLYCWGAVSAFQIVLMFLAPYIIMPLFNKFEPLEDGPLKTAIEEYARAQRFAMKGVFKMDGSRRSTKSNAFFTGFGKSRRIVLFDTLIEKHTVDELVAILAHEMGHYKKKHIPFAIVRSLATTGFMFFLLSLFMKNSDLFDAFRMKEVSVYASFIFFGFLYAPMATLIGLTENVISRRCEYQADRYAIETTGKPEAMITAMKKLSVDNLANLTPHPMTVFLSYSHPPVLARIQAMRRAEAGGTAS